MSIHHVDGQESLWQEQPEKRCAKCHKWKPLTDFGKVKGRIRSYCRECHSAANMNEDCRKEKRCANCKEVKPVVEFSRLGRRFQPYCKVCSRMIVAEHHRAEQESGRATVAYRVYYRKTRKWVRLKHRYGIDQEEYESLNRMQNGVCAFCLKPETQQYLGTTLDLAVDHDHATGKVRGLLCRKCNQGLGLFKENIEALKRAAQYLELHRS